MTPADRPNARTSERDTIAWLAALGPEAQGEIDETLLEDNLQLSPYERLRAASEAATQLERLRRAMARAEREPHA